MNILNNLANEIKTEYGETKLKETKLFFKLILIANLIPHIYLFIRLTNTDFWYYSIFLSPISWLASNIVIFFIIWKLIFIREFILDFDKIGQLAMSIALITATLTSCSLAEAIYATLDYDYFYQYGSFNFFVVTIVFITPFAWFLPFIAQGFFVAILLIFVGTWILLPFILIISLVKKIFKK